MVDELNRAIAELLGRASGPMHIRLWIQPTMAAKLAIRAGFRDAHDCAPPFLWEFVKNKARRHVLIQTALQDVGRLLILAFLIDSLYQLIVFKNFYLLQALIVTFILGLLPYIILRGLVTRLQRRF